MKLTTNHTSPYKQQKSPNFGWLKVCSGNVIKRSRFGREKLIPVDICLIRDEDRGLMQKILKNWKDTTTFGYAVAYRFLSMQKAPSTFPVRYNFFMLIPSDPPQKTTILSKLPSCFKFTKSAEKPEPLSIGIVSHVFDEIQLSYLQASPYVFKHPGKISGAGQMLIYGVSRYIQSLSGPQLKINSTNDCYFEHLFNIKPNNNFFEILPQKLTSFMEESRKKFKMNKESTSLPKDIINEINNNTYTFTPTKHNAK